VKDMKRSKKNKIMTVGIMAAFLVSVLSMAFSPSYAAASEGAGEEPVVPPQDSAVIPTLADLDSIVDPLGQSVKENATLDLARKTVIDVINPMQWALELNGFDIIRANIPLDLDLWFEMNFPMNAETSYDPYDVHNGSAFNFVTDLDNKGCTPSMTVGVDFMAKFSEMEFSLFEIANLLWFTATWDDIDYHNNLTIPFYGVETKMGNWISYDIVDRYYTLDDILHLDISDYGIRGGIGVNVQYNLHSWVTSKLDVKNQTGDLVQTNNLNWQDTGSKVTPINVAGDALHGDEYTIEVGDWVYHIAHDVTFTIWADIGLEVIGISLIDETFDYSYTLGLGELTFPEKNDYTFVSNPEVMSGSSVHNVPAAWNLVNFNVDTQKPGEFSIFDYSVEIPENDEIKKWFADANVSAGLSAGIDFNMPYNMLSYYNSRKVTSGNTFDYNVLVDSYGTSSPSIDYNVDAYLDLSAIDILGLKLDKYEVNLDGTLYALDDIRTPFEKQRHEIEITSLVKLDQASKMLNEYISDALYGINPDIQFQAWIVLEMEGYMSGTITTTSGTTVTEATEFKWDEQFDTQTSRIQVPASLNPGDKFNVTYTNLQYNLKVTPGIKIGASVLGGIIGFDYTFLLPVSLNLDDKFLAPDFTEEITVQNLGVETKDLAAVAGDIPVVAGDFNVEGTMALENIGSQNDYYQIDLISDKLPAGTTGQWKLSGDSVWKNFGDSTGEINPITNGTQTVDWKLTLGSLAHRDELIKNEVKLKASSYFAPNSAYDTATTSLLLLPDADFEAFKTEIMAEDEVDVTPGVNVVVPVKVSNDGKFSTAYTVSVAGTNAVLYNPGDASFTLLVGQSKTVDVIVDAGSSTTPAGEHQVDVSITELTNGNNVIVQSFNYSVAEIVNVTLGPNALVKTDEKVYLGDEATYQFKLSNQGNVNSQVEISVQSSDFTAYKVNSVTGAKNITIATGATNVDVVVELDVSSAKPGKNTFYLIGKEAGKVFYNQTFDINVKQVSVSITANDTYEYKEGGEAVLYLLTLTNEGAAADTFKVSISGLDTTAYTLDAIAATGIWLPGGASKTLNLKVKPTDIRKVPAGANGMQVQVTSATYNSTSMEKASAVKMPAVYGFQIASNKLLTKDSTDYFEMSFEIENTGNVADNFTISVAGIGSQSVLIYVNDVQLTATGNNTLTIERNSKAVVTVRIIKTEIGKFAPIITVKNSKGTVMGSFTAAFTYGDVATPWYVILLIVGAAIVGMVASVKIFTQVKKKRANKELGEVSAPSKLSRIKERVSEKMSDMKKSEKKDKKKLSLKDKIVTKREERVKLKEEAEDKEFWDGEEDDGWEE
jgi:hypothetical protein